MESVVAIIASVSVQVNNIVLKVFFEARRKSFSPSVKKQQRMWCGSVKDRLACDSLGQRVGKEIRMILFTSMLG